MKALWCCLVASVSLFIQGAPSNNIFVSQQSVIRRELILPTSEFNASRMEERFREILAQTPRETRVLKVEAMDRPTSRLLVHKGVIDGHYGHWKLHFKDYAQGIPPFAELLLLDNNAAMRIRDSQGRVSLKVLRGQNPYLVRAGNKEFMLLHLFISESRNLDRGGYAVYLRFYLVTHDHFDEATARAVLQALRESAPSIEDIAVAIRNDPWFVLDSDFPVVSPFLTEINPPSKEQFEKAPQWTCIQSDEHMACW
jgi:hypothetical protein